MRFATPYWLALIPFLVLGWKGWLRRMERPALTYSLEIPSSLRIFNPIKVGLSLRILALSLLLVALARPQSSFTQIERRVDGIDILLVLDLSASMNIEDLAEASRLTVAKETMKQFIEGRRDDRIGLVVFSGEPLTLVPPTLDYGLVLSSLRDVETGVLRDGTAIGDGLSLAVGRLRTSKAKSKVIILLTDGDNNVGRVDPATAGELAKGYGIRVYTIAAGKEGRVRLPIRQKGAFGGTITTYQWFDNALNPALLEKIAQMTHGKFYRVTDANALSEVFVDIDLLEKDTQKVQDKVKYREMFEIPLIFALLLLILEQLYGMFRRRVIL